MKIYPLGVGGAFTKSNFHNNYIMQLDEKYLLIDAGTTLRNSLSQSGFTYLEIDYVFISHLHFDHVGGLEELVMQRYWNFEGNQHLPRKTPIILHEKLLEPLKSLLINGLQNQGRRVEDFCEFICLTDGEIFKIGDYSFLTFDTSNTHVDGMLSFGFKLQGKNSNIVFTADIKKLEQANILAQVDENTAAIFQDTSFTPNGVHATFEEILNYYPKKMHQKIYAMHYNDDIQPFMDSISQSGINLVKKMEVVAFE